MIITMNVTERELLVAQEALRLARSRYKENYAELMAMGHEYAARIFESQFREAEDLGSRIESILEESEA